MIAIQTELLTACQTSLQTKKFRGHLKTVKNRVMTAKLQQHEALMPRHLIAQARKLWF